jgi:uncharacterized protein (DUF58 family)
LDREVLVFPAVRPLPTETLHRLVGAGTAAVRRRGRGHDLYNLRSYRPGDDPRHIHWRTSAKLRVLLVREMEAETTEDARVVLMGTGAHNAARLEAALSEAASLVAHLARTGAGVELVGPGLFVRLGRGPGQARRILTALALYEPNGARRASGESEGRGTGALREIQVDLD